MCGIDIGPKSVTSFSEIIQNSKAIRLNGPMGIFEIKESAQGAFEIAEAIAKIGRLFALSAAVMRSKGLIKAATAKMALLSVQAAEQIYNSLKEKFSPELMFSTNSFTERKKQSESSKRGARPSSMHPALRYFPPLSNLFMHIESKFQSHGSLFRADS
jgi:uncharacterized pyridoxal phosphate-containing UPF0001 family protein